MFSKLLYRKKLLIFFVLCLMGSYFLFSNLLTEKKVEYAAYSLVPSPLNNPTTSKENLPRKRYVRSFFAISSSYVDRLLRNNDYYANQISNELNRNIALNISTPAFNCRCGRVSDPCVCCGFMHLSQPVGALPVEFYQPIVSFDSAPTEDSDKFAVAFCTNVTYLPKSQSLKAAGYLVNVPHTDALKHKSELKWSKYFTPNSTLILYSELFPSVSPVHICAENSAHRPLVQLCTEFTSLQYLYEDNPDHKTAFVGCMHVSVMLKRQYLIADYRKVCFRAHRGAVDDADLAEQKKVKEEVKEALQPPVVNQKKAMREELAEQNATEFNEMGAEKDENMPLAVELAAANRAP